jgi:transcription termination/antitermination protein NusG
MQHKDEKDLSAYGTDNRGAYLEPSYLSSRKAWLAVYVKVHQEQKMSERLNMCGIENFVAIQQEYRQWNDRIKLINRVVLPMIVFVHVTPVQRRQVLQMPSAVHYLVACGKHSPAVIPDEQMDKFKFMLDYCPEAVNVISIPIKRGEKVRIVKGPLAGLTGEIMIIKSEKRIGVCLDMLGYACVKIPIGYLSL